MEMYHHVHQWRNHESLIMNKKEHNSLKASISFDTSVFCGVIADKFKQEPRAEQTLCVKLKQIASSFLGKDKLLKRIVISHCYCFAPLDISDWSYSLWILVTTVLME